MLFSRELIGCDFIHDDPPCGDQATHPDKKRASKTHKTSNIHIKAKFPFSEMISVIHSSMSLFNAVVGTALLVLCFYSSVILSII